MVEVEWDLPQLRALAAVVDAGSLEAAAADLHVTPSAVSQRLKALERAVGTVLVRRTRPIAPTPAGERVLLLARQIEALIGEVDLSDGAARPVLALAINADSLATWALAALTPLANRAQVRIVREDQDLTADLLRTGAVMGAVTSQTTPVQGCSVEPLGAMRYLPMVSPELLRRVAGSAAVGPAVTAVLAELPYLVFDDHDRLQTGSLERMGIDPGLPPRHVVPAAAEFAQAVRLGWGWGMVPEAHVAAAPPTSMMRLPGVAHTDVPLYWQQWSLRMPDLDAVAAALRQVAARELHPIGAS